MLSVALRHAFADFSLDLGFEAPAGLTVLFGPSGSGKTSVVNGVAGLLRPDAGRIVLGDRVLFDHDGGLNLPTHRRHIGYVFQDARLFPHMTVAANLTYGGSHDRANIIDLLGLADLLHRRPATLSGGEKQRVALGRALMSDPELLLMDEPLAGLDTPRKAEIMPYIEALRDRTGLPILYVSHDVGEVARLATTLVLIDRGRVTRAGPVDAVLADPASVPLMGPRDAGAVIRGTVAAHDRDGLGVVAFDGGRLILPGPLGPVGAAVRVRVAAQDVILSLTAPTGISALNVLPVTVTGMQGGAAGVAVGLRVGNTALLARVTRRSADALGLVAGQQMFAILKANAIAPQDVGT